MYCSKCGKEIDYEAEYCKECQKVNEYYEKMADKIELTDEECREALEKEEKAKTAVMGSRKKGFGVALTSTISSAVSYILGLVAFYYSMFTVTVAAESGHSLRWAYSQVRSSGTALFVLAFAVTIAGMVMGICSIHCFKKQRSEGKVAPVATLVLGIVGLALGGLSLLLNCYYAFLVAMVISWI